MSCPPTTPGGTTSVITDDVDGIAIALIFVNKVRE